MPPARVLDMSTIVEKMMQFQNLGLEMKLLIKLAMTCYNVFAFVQQKREKRMLANWRLLTRSLLIRERLKKRYDTEVTSTVKCRKYHLSLLSNLAVLRRKL